MRVLLVNTLHYRHGGPSIHTQELAGLLRDRGISAEIFAMQHPKNLSSPISEYFPSQIDYPELLREGGVKNSFKVLKRTFYSKESRINFEKLLDNYQPDIIHLQNFLHHLTPSIIFPAIKKNIPVIWTLHDSVLVCPNTNLFDDNLKKPCTRCNSLLKRLILPPLKRCKKSSFGASLVASVEALSFALIGLKKKIDFFVAPSKFLIMKLEEMGFCSDNFVHIPNFTDIRSRKPSKGEFVLYFGRIEHEKGVFTLLEAIKGMGIPLIIAGAGSGVDELENAIKGFDYITYLGQLEKNELGEVLKNARFTVVPSMCYENAPMTIVESAYYSKPVIGSDIGGIPELVEHGKSGFIFRAGNAEDLEKYIDKLWNSPDIAMEMGMYANQMVTRKHSPDVYLERILRLYNEAREKK